MRRAHRTWTGQKGGWREVALLGGGMRLSEGPEAGKGLVCLRTVRNLEWLGLARQAGELNEMEMEMSAGTRSWGAL